MSCKCLTAELLAAAIYHQASRFVDLKEFKPNQDWDNPKTPGPDTALVKELRALMLPTPWQPGWAYCAAFCEGIVAAAIAEVGTPEQVAKFRAVMTAGVLDSRNRFKAKGMLVQTPVEGAVWLAQHGSTSNGHAGIVTSVAPTSGGIYIKTIEANTSKDATDPDKDREGDWITRRGPFSSQGRGTLKTVGFVTPSAIIKLITA